MPSRISLKVRVTVSGLPTCPSVLPSPLSPPPLGSSPHRCPIQTQNEWAVTEQRWREGLTRCREEAEARLRRCRSKWTSCPSRWVRAGRSLLPLCLPIAAHLLHVSDRGHHKCVLHKSDSTARSLLLPARSPPNRAAGPFGAVAPPSSRAVILAPPAASQALPVGVLPVPAPVAAPSPPQPHALGLGPAGACPSPVTPGTPQCPPEGQQGWECPCPPRASSPSTRPACARGPPRARQPRLCAHRELAVEAVRQSWLPCCPPCSCSGEGSLGRKRLPRSRASWATVPRAWHTWRGQGPRRPPPTRRL